jgi:hypothetical protein
LLSHRYVLYGLGVHSQIPLWGPGTSECPSDVTVRWERVATPASVVAETGRPDADTGELRLSWPDLGEMVIRSGTEIRVATGDHVECSHVRHLVCGIGLGLALHQRGVFALHASAVAIDGRAMVFVGPKGAGKSTLAAALSARGHTLLSDDVVALDLPDDGAPQLRPGPTNLNLWPDSAAATGYDPGALSRIWSRSAKLAQWIPEGEASAPVPLGAIFVLASSESSPQILPRLSPIDAFAQLVGHTHAFRWISDKRCLPRHLEQCRSVLRSVPVFRLERGQSLDSLETLVRQVEACGAPLPAGRCVA